jgi:hypothetical protein
MTGFAYFNLVYQFMIVLAVITFGMGFVYMFFSREDSEE